MKPVILLGLESSGKTSLAHRLQGLDEVSVNVRGSTKSYGQYATNDYVIMDTPGFRKGMISLFMIYCQSILPRLKKSGLLHVVLISMKKCRHYTKLLSAINLHISCLESL